MPLLSSSRDLADWRVRHRCGMFRRPFSIHHFQEGHTNNYGIAQAMTGFPSGMQHILMAKKCKFKLGRWSRGSSSYCSVIHRLIESLGLKIPPRSFSPIVTFSPIVIQIPPRPLNHITKFLICSFFKHFQGWWLQHFPEQSVPVFEHLILPNSNLFWHNLRSFPLGLLLVSWEKTPAPALLQPLFREL